MDVALFSEPDQNAWVRLADLRAHLTAPAPRDRITFQPRVNRAGEMLPRRRRWPPRVGLLEIE